MEQEFLKRVINHFRGLKQEIGNVNQENQL